MGVLVKFFSAFFWILDVFFILLITERRGGLGQTQAGARHGRGMDRDSVAKTESQAALEILRMVSSLREVSRVRAAFGCVSQSCQGWDKESPQRVPSTTRLHGGRWHRLEKPVVPWVA